MKIETEKEKFKMKRNIFSSVVVVVEVVDAYEDRSGSDMCSCNEFPKNFHECIKTSI